ncbi:protein FANTASTIC FOUR 2-like [Phragmites australis]|uniref:protein FANTASTIC FOUR 2-like n=1 Tax=Phragmites australis TaxID=29695 RepID=UPI002D788DEE|nr:protein FANTASTIC FOUR 2-like [Phragmites australis]
MPSLLDSPQQFPATGAWASLYAVQEHVKPRHVLVPAAATAKKPAYGGRKKNLETCTEALGCETGAVDAGNVSDVGDAGVEAECVERKQRTREEEEMVTEEGRTRQLGRRVREGPLPPPLTTLARGASRVRMVHERRDGRLAVYAVRTPGIVEAERSVGRLRMRLLPLPCGTGTGNAAAACRRQESRAAESVETKEAREAEEEAEDYGVAKYVRGGRCVEPEGGASTTAARRGKQWEPETAAAFWVATS